MPIYSDIIGRIQKGAPMEDKKIVDLFWQRNHQAIIEIQNKYGKLCLQLANRITGSLQDAEEIVNETYLGMWNRIPPEKPQHLKSFVCKITRNISIDRVRYYQAEKRKHDLHVSLEELQDILSGTDTPESIYDRKETAAYISDFLRSIKSEKRIMFLQRYWYCKTISEIANEFDITEGKVKVTLHRVRRELKKYLEDKGVAL